MDEKGCFFKNPQDAFKEAIEEGALSSEPGTPLYAGNWMYMHSNAKGDYFKNIITRSYIVVR